MYDHRRPRLRGHDAQHVDRGPADEQQVGRFGEVERRGLGEDVGGGDRERRAIAAADPEGEDLVTDLTAAEAICVWGPIAPSTPATSRPTGAAARPGRRRGRR